MASKPSIAIVGPGRLGSTLALALYRAGYPITSIVTKSSVASRRKASVLASKVGASARVISKIRLNADLVWLCVPDREISAVARKLATDKTWKAEIAFHSSGALSSDALALLRKRGTAVASVHPMMTFVRGSTPSIKEVPFALEGDVAAVTVARKIVRDLGGMPVSVKPPAKAAYHAWGTFLSPLLVATLVASEEVARIAGLSAKEARKRMMPIVRQTITNYAALGPAAAFSGPLVRGDAEVVRLHLKALKKTPTARAVYITLARSALQNLPVQQRSKLRKILSD